MVSGALRMSHGDTKRWPQGPPMVSFGAPGFAFGAPVVGHTPKSSLLGPPILVSAPPLR